MEPVPFRLAALQQYLERRHGAPVIVDDVRELGSTPSGEAALKQFGYGRPLLVSYRLVGMQDDTQRYLEVFHSIKRTPFGRERDDDRVAAAWLDFETFNDLPRHVRAVDRVGLSKEGTLRSLQDLREVLLVTTYQKGALYADDLLRLRDGGDLRQQDLARAATLAGYLAKIHSRAYDGPAEQQNMLWRRRLRDLLGHGEGIMGITDNYPLPLPFVSAADLQQIENQANAWRWRLKGRQERLCQVHGDFHPFNILFDEAGALHVLDRSRGPWGAAADDVSCLSINYLFFSLQRSGRFAEPFNNLYHHFWKVYLAQRPDASLLETIQPWFAWRALVLASPIWYPDIDEAVRRRLLTFARRLMDADRFDWQEPERYMEAQA